MQRTLEGQTHGAKHIILLCPVPQRLRYLSRNEGWKPIKDEIRRLACENGLAGLRDTYKIIIYVDHEPLCAACSFDFDKRDDARKIYGLIRNHVFEGCVMQPWIFQPGRNGGGLETVDGPRDPFTNIILPAPVPKPPPPADPSLSLPSRELSRLWSTQTGSFSQEMLVSRPGGNPNVSQDRVPVQPLPAASDSVHDSFNNALAHVSPYATNLDLYQQRLCLFSMSVDDASEQSDSSRTLHNTPELSSSSRTSSVSAIPDAYSPARSSNYGTFNFIPGSPHSNYNSSVSSSSNPYTPASSRNQSGSSHAFRDTASDQACKVIIRYVKAGVTHEDLSELLKQEMHLYVQHERPKRSEQHKWTVKFSNREDAEEARERLNNFVFKGQKLKIHLSNGGPRTQINSGGSTTSATSSSITPRPTIVDGSLTS